MADFYFLRHSTTQWNIDKRLQGRTDIPLAPQGIKHLQQHNIPASFTDMRWFCSPLQRARQTAELLNLNAASEMALIEMNWGQWEGHTLAELNQQTPEILAREEARGMDLTPPEGETPRQVLQRVSDWAELLSLQDSEQRFGCICHKGIIRAVYAAASGWNMLGKPPHKLDFNALQSFRFNENGWQILELNISLESASK